ncbi:sulfur carrier protein ThiS [Cochlodiniinecator piscidefendens]|uniref:sulfur carrier protein ThiS n=1 Tax=Cochlodiniinecator piscidefendens TaxID=2715756 RepID=UPI0014081003|nr:sulfur carrier protein ThiS [Cochlodiniinecator piscidefendens]
MNILVNDIPREINTPTLAAALVELGFDHPAIATAVNGVFVPASNRAAQVLSQGDKLEILSPMQGG